MCCEERLAKTPAGLVARIAARLLALTLGMFLNAQMGRPLRSLVAYDGRHFHIQPRVGAGRPAVTWRGGAAAREAHRRHRPAAGLLPGSPHSILVPRRLTGRS